MSIKSQREMLEAAIAANFDDMAAHSAYADLLMEEGDPRGEYIQLRLPLDDENLQTSIFRDRLERSSKIYQAHERDWLGALAPFLLGKTRATVEPVTPNIEFTFYRGWLCEVHVHNVRDAFPRVLADAPEARMLQVLHLGNTNLPNNQGPLEPLLGSSNLRTLKKFSLGDPELDNTFTDGRYAAALVTQMPQLRELQLRAVNVNAHELFALPMPNLEWLYVDHLATMPLDILAANSTLTNVKRLHLSQANHNPVPEQANAMLPLEDADEVDAFTHQKLRYLLTAPQLHNLSELTLQVRAFRDAGCTEIVRSGILRRLRKLDLRYCEITDAGAEVLAKSPDITHLESIDIGGNQLTLAGVEALRATEIRVQWDQQWGEYYHIPEYDNDDDVIV